MTTPVWEGHGEEVWDGHFEYIMGGGVGGQFGPYHGEEVWELNSDLIIGRICGRATLKF